MPYKLRYYFLEYYYLYFLNNDICNMDIKDMPFILILLDNDNILDIILDIKKSRGGRIDNILKISESEYLEKYKNYPTLIKIKNYYKII